MWQIVPLNLLAWRELRAYQRLRWALLAISLQAIAIILVNGLRSATVTAAHS